MLQAQDIAYSTRGFGEITLGASIKRVRKLLKPTDEIPNDAWFRPLTYEEYHGEIGGDSLDYFQSQEMDLITDSLENVGRDQFVIKDKKHKKFKGLKIAAIELIWDSESELITCIKIVLDKEVVNDESKSAFMAAVSVEFGEAYCTVSVSGPKQPFECSWDIGLEQITISDMDQFQGAGESINISFYSFEE
ncbi:MAG: hypothetical protein ACI837_001838 [Crocinitomicaceae bacterium]|jgi:hypothetical protein